MALTELKSNLSDFRKPLKTQPLSKSSITTPNKDFNRSPISDNLAMAPNITKTRPTPEKMSPMVQNASKITGRHQVTEEIINSSKIQGRHTTGKTLVVENTISGRHTTGETIQNITQISGRHTTGTQVSALGSASGRHTVGVNVRNTSFIVGRHEKDNSNLNKDGIIPLTNPAGRHTGGPDTPNNSQIFGRHISDNSNLNKDGIIPLTNPAGRHNTGPDTPNLSTIGGRHESPHNPIHSSLDRDSLLVKFESIFQPNQSIKLFPQASNLDIDSIPSKYININTDGLHYPTDSPMHSNLNIDGNLTKYIDSVTFGHHYPIDAKNHSSLNWDGKQPPATNEWFTFTIDQQNTKYSGVTKDGESFKYPTSIRGGRLWNVPVYEQPAWAARFDAQLGSSPMFKNSGFNEKTLYGETVKQAADGFGFLGKYAITRKSPSPLDEQYNKFKLRDEATNYTYVKHPLILRGIQRDKNVEPQRWGTDTKYGLDDGLVRGGSLTAIERAAVDTARITKWMASPKGLLWITKQVGLGLTNPKVETPLDGADIFGIPNLTRQTRVHTGLASLLSVPGTAFGLHFTRHGVPGANELASYENVVDNINKNFPKQNRLLKLKREFFRGTAEEETLGGIAGAILDTARKVTETLSEKFGGFKGQPIKTLSGASGPQSVYGIGATIIRKPDHLVSEIPHQRSVGNIGKVGKAKAVIDAFSGFGSRSAPRSVGGTDLIDTGIKSYSTLAYSQISSTARERSEGTTIPNDFRKDTDRPKADKAKYEKNNLTDKFGMGTQGKVGVGRGAYDQKNLEYDNKGNATINPQGSGEFRGDEINAIDARISSKDAVKYDDIYKLDRAGAAKRDFVKLFFTGPKQMTTAENTATEILVFRATMGNITDQFSPSWSPHKMIGRADPVYTYDQWTRSVTFDFRVAATSRDEMRPIWRKLNYLASWTAPEYNVGTIYRAPWIRVTLGDLFQETPCFISSLTYTIDDNSPWEINLENDPDIYQVPMYVNVSTTLTMAMDYRPQWNGRMYSLSRRGTHRTNDKLNPNWLYDSSQPLGKANDNFVGPPLPPDSSEGNTGTVAEAEKVNLSDEQN